MPRRHEPDPTAVGSANSAYSDHEVSRAADLMKALANPLRLRCMLLCLDGTRCVHELVAATGASQPLISQHLRVLRTTGLLLVQRRGREVAYSAADEHVRHIVLDAIEHANQEGTSHDHGTHDSR